MPSHKNSTITGEVYRPSLRDRISSAATVWDRIEATA
jgi:hypothetical protein